jgi:hypothetical protein
MIRGPRPVPSGLPRLSMGVRGRLRNPRSDSGRPDAVAVCRRLFPVIPPTKTALAKAAKRRTKLGAARVPEFPDSGASRGNTAKPQVAPDSGVPRDSGDPGVSKKTITQKLKFRPYAAVALLVVGLGSN